MTVGTFFAIWGTWLLAFMCARVACPIPTTATRGWLVIMIFSLAGFFTAVIGFGLPAECLP